MRRWLNRWVIVNKSTSPQVSKVINKLKEKETIKQYKALMKVYDYHKVTKPTIIY